MTEQLQQDQLRRERSSRTGALSSPRRLAPHALVLAFGFACALAFSASGEDEAPAASPAKKSAKNSIVIRGLDTEGEAAARKLIADQINLIKSKGLTRPRADDAAYFLERGLRRLGYRDAEVLWRIGSPGETLHLDVENALPRTLGEISFPGAPAEDIAPLKALATAATRDRTSGILSGQLPFVENDLESGVKAIANHYPGLGYWDATIGPPEYEESGDGSSVDVAIPVATGSLFEINRIVFEGALALAPELLEQSVAPFRGEPATMENLLAMRDAVAAVYQREGYYRAAVSLQPDPVSDDELNVAITIDAGGSFTVSAVEIRGYERLKPEFLEKRFEPLQGRPYRPSAVDSVLRDLVSLRLFDDISIVPEETGDETLRLLVDIDEAKSKEVGLYGGYGTFDGFVIGIALRERSLFGTGRLIGLDAELNGRGQRAEVMYLDKWFLDSLWSLDARFFTLNEELEGYNKTEHGFRTELSRQFTPAYSVSFFANSSYTDVEAAGLTAADLDDQRYLVNSVGMTHTFDKRDSPVLPSHGFIVEGTLDAASAALASEIGFLRGTARFSYYKSLGKDYVLSLGARSGAIIPTEGTDEIPIDLRFFSGGSTSVRSFPERELPSRDNDTLSLGGEFFNTFNAELTRTIFGAAKGALFLDAGNLGRDITDFGLESMHYAAGLGLRIDLPFGPLRADYGWNLNRRENEPAGAFHMTIGIAF